MPLSVPLVAGETVRSAMMGPRAPGREPINRCAPVGTASNPLNEPFSVSSLPASVAVTEPPPERSARVPTRRGPGDSRNGKVLAAGAAPSSVLRRHTPARRLAALSAVLRIRPRLGKICIGVLEHFILITVTQLALQVGIAGGGGYACFFFNRALLSIAVRVILFWHRG